MGAKGVKRPDLPCERSPPGGSSSLRSTAAEATRHCRVDTQNAQNEAAEKVPLNYRITCILCLANIIATC